MHELRCKDAKFSVSTPSHAKILVTPHRVVSTECTKYDSIQPMEIALTHDAEGWDAFIAAQPWRPFLQSWTMGEVYGDIGQKPIRMTVTESGKILCVCFGSIVKARRGTYISVPYGPLIDESISQAEVTRITTALILKLKTEAKKQGCSFIRFSPFWPQGRHQEAYKTLGSIQSPLHMLAEHVWYLPLEDSSGKRRTEDELQADMRKTTRNLIRRAEKDGVTIEKSPDPVEDLPEFIALHDETRKRHGFTAYTHAFFQSQVRRFSERKECSVYLAKFQGKTIAASIHMHAFGETSYHHGASSSEYQKIPASYLLQWTAIRDAMKRGDRIYNFWGIAPMSDQRIAESGEQHAKNESFRYPLPTTRSHPFAGVTLFKTGFGGHVLNLVHCKDEPVTQAYWLTYAFERYRKWKRGF